MRLATSLTAMWLPLALAMSMLRFADFAGASTASPTLGRQYVDYLLRFPSGRAELVALLATAVLASVLPLVRTLTGVAGAAGMALAALARRRLQGTHPPDTSVSRPPSPSESTCWPWRSG